MKLVATPWSKKALFVGMVGILVQVVPLSVEYCHVPFVLSKLVTAIPRTAPTSGSTMFREAVKVARSTPGLVTGFSLMGVGNVAVVLFSTGAVLGTDVWKRKCPV